MLKPNERPDNIYPKSFQAFLRFSRGEINATNYARERRVAFSAIVKETKELIEGQKEPKVSK